MSIASKNHHASDKSTAMVSQASRRMAMAPGIGGDLSYKEEYERLVSEKRDIELELQNYNKAAFAKAQLRIRDQYSGDGNLSLRHWLQTKVKMEDRRKEIVERKANIERRMTQIKPHLRAEAIEENKKTDHTEILLQISDDLRDIKSLLSRLCERISP